MTPRVPLVRRKLRPPAVPETFIERPELLKKLAEGLDPRKKLTTVCAGPGYGKSTSVARYVQSTGHPSAWINLESFDGDLATFLHYLIGGATAPWPEAAREVLELLAASARPETILPSLVGLLSEALSDHADGSFILVLDDFHAVQDSEPVVQAVEALVAYLPEHVQLILISRSQVPLRVPQMRVRQQIVEVGIPDLRFNPPDVGALVRSVSGKALSQDEERELFESTDGWAASLVLAAQQPERVQLVGQAQDSLFEYLAQEVFADLAPDRQEFLLRTSLLPVVEAALCREALDLEDVEPTLADLRRSNLLLGSSEAEGHYHPIFQAFLRAKLSTTHASEAVRSWRSRAAALVAATSPEDALNLLLEGDLYDEAEPLLLGIADDLLAQARLDTLDRYLRRFPEDLLMGSAWLSLYAGELRRSRGQLDAALPLLENAERRAGELGDRKAAGRALGFQSALWGARGDSRLATLAGRALEQLPAEDGAGRAFAYNALGLSHQMANQSHEALKAFEAALAAYRDAADSVGQSKVLHNLGLAYARHGDFGRASATYRESIRQAELAGRRAYPATYNNLAALHHSLGEFDTAWGCAEEGLQLAQLLGLQRDALWTQLTLGMIACSLGQLAKAGDFFQEAREGALAMGDRPLEAQAVSGMAELARNQGQLERAYELLRQAVDLRGVPIESPAMIELQIPMAHVALERGDLETARPLLEVARTTLESQDFRYRLAQVLFLEERRQRLAGSPEADATRKRAEALCEANGYAHLLATSRRGAPPEPGVETLSKVVPASHEPALRLRFFGSFEALTETGAIPNKQWQGTKSKLVLAYLLQNRQGVTREQLAALLYGDEDVSRSAILMIISRLRQALEPDLAKNAPSRFIQWRDGTYGFNFGAPYQLDVQEFEFQLDESRASGLDDPAQVAALKRALGLYRGRYLKDMSDNLWVQATQEHYHQRALAAFQRVISHHEQAERHDAALDWADRTLAVDNCAEFAHRAKMTALSRLGNRPGALRHFQQLEEVLMQELGVEPSSESRELYRALASGRM